jgi:hypothetical protein
MEQGSLLHGERGQCAGLGPVQQLLDPSQQPPPGRGDGQDLASAITLVTLPGDQPGLLRRVEKLLDGAEPGALAALTMEQRALLHACATEVLAADAPQSWIPSRQLAWLTS